MNEKSNTKKDVEINNNNITNSNYLKVNEVNLMKNTFINNKRFIQNIVATKNLKALSVDN